MSSFCELCKSGEWPEIAATCDLKDCIYHRGNEKNKAIYEEQQKNRTQGTKNLL